MFGSSSSSSMAPDYEKLVLDELVKFSVTTVDTLRTSCKPALDDLIKKEIQINVGLATIDTAKQKFIENISMYRMAINSIIVQKEEMINYFKKIMSDLDKEEQAIIAKKY